VQAVQAQVVQEVTLSIIHNLAQIYQSYSTQQAHVQVVQVERIRQVVAVAVAAEVEEVDTSPMAITAAVAVAVAQEPAVQAQVVQDGVQEVIGDNVGVTQEAAALQVAQQQVVAVAVAAVTQEAAAVQEVQVVV